MKLALVAAFLLAACSSNQPQKPEEKKDGNVSYPSESRGMDSTKKPAVKK